MALQELSYYIIEPTSDAFTSEPFRVSESLGPYVFMDKDVTFPGGNWYVDMLTPDSTEDWVQITELSSFDESFLLPGDGIYRIRKDAGSDPYGVFINRVRVSPSWLIEPTDGSATSAVSILVEDRPAQLVIAIPNGENTTTKVYLDILLPDESWSQTDKFDLGGIAKPRRILLEGRGVYRVRKSSGNKPVGVSIYR